VALLLMRAGYRRVSVVRGGFPAMVDTGIAMMPKETYRPPSALAAREGRLVEATNTGTPEIHQ
jgi:hypothetical protein